MPPTRTAPEPAARGAVDADPVLSVRGLKTYFELDEGVVRAVDGVSFDVHPGEILGIVGESGCGKSITMKSVMRTVERPGRLVAGSIRFRPKRPRGLRLDQEGAVDLARLDPRSRHMRTVRGGEIALIPQEPMSAFSPLHTVGNQIVEAILLHRRVGQKEARSIAIESLREVGIPNPAQRIDAYSWQLSGGLRQRAIIAMALACNPTVLIADEPTTAVDVTTQAQILDLIQRLQREHGASVVFITHDLGVIAQLTEHVVVMYLGRVMEAGPVDAIFHEPLHPYTRALLRSVPSVDSPPRVQLPTIEGSIPHPFNRPPGCPFHPRCPDAMPGHCDADVPALHEVAPGRPVACFLHHDLVESEGEP
jgi:oligopeptide/dipeptide ABC transporter ATP-binding protein